MARDSRESYDKIKPGYYHQVLIHGKPLQKFWHSNKFRKVIEWAGELKGKTLLDLGCGPGSLISLLPRTYKKALGVDFSGPQIEFARKNFRGSRIEWKRSSIQDLRLRENVFDVVFMVEVIEHLKREDTRRIFSKVRRLLSREGRFIMTTPNYRSLWPILEFFWNRVSKVNYEEQHINRFDIPRIKRELLAAGFRRIRVGSFYLLSPFLSLVSLPLAEKLMRLEERLFPTFGSLIIVDAKK
jgi:2-polyprenyl-3-methyl-5-hydroxy-6-metoxy-1,4-benzoquinol methylase